MDNLAIGLEEYHVYVTLLCRGTTGLGTKLLIPNLPDDARQGGIPAVPVPGCHNKRLQLPNNVRIG
jgi:hypothetical protein